MSYDTSAVSVRLPEPFDTKVTKTAIETALPGSIDITHLHMATCDVCGRFLDDRRDLMFEI